MLRIVAILDERPEPGLIEILGRIPVQSIDAVLEALGFPATEQRIKGAV